MTDSTLSQIARKPVRIQRKRTKGWKMPPNTVYVGRPTKWGNPWRIAPYQSRDAVLRAFKNYWEKHNGCTDDGNRWVTRVTAQSELRGKDLACWCKLSDPCHADILLEIANAPSTSPDEKE